MSAVPLRKHLLRDLLQPISTCNPGDDSTIESFRYVDLSAVDQESKSITGDHLVPTSEAPSRARQLIRAHDVLVSTVRPNLNAVALVPERLDGAIASTGFSVLRTKQKLLASSYLFHWVRGELFISEMVRRATGASYPAVSDRVVHEALIPLPPLEEQWRIAAILDKAELLRVKRRQALAKLDTFVQSLFLEMFGDPFSNPHKFTRKRLGEIIDFVGGAQPPKSVFSDIGGANKVRLVQIRDFKSDRFATFIPKSLARRNFDEDDVMIGRYGPPVFQIFRGLSGSYNVALIKASPKVGVRKSFIFHLLRDQAIQRFVIDNSERTAGQSGVNLELLEKLEAFLPPMNMQVAFERVEKKIVEQEEMLVKSMQALDSSFVTFQHRAFRGEL